MVIKELSQFPRATVEQLLSGVPFYKAVRQQDEWQFELLLQHSRIITYSMGESVLRQGDWDNWLFFLLKGQLDVTVELADGEQKVNQITPGEVFGDLAMLVGRERSANVVVSEHCREVMAFGTNFEVFGALEQMHPVNLETKLTYYRNAVHNLRWKLEVYRNEHPENELASRHRQVKLYTGPKDTFEELQALHRQAVELAKLLIAWNSKFGRVQQAVSLPDEQLLAAMG
jgi:CRP/FNR family transcriptional regulator, cyclic AMP receptor protein